MSIHGNKRHMIQAGRDMLGFPYKLGGWGGDNNVPPNGIDCRGFCQMSFKAIGAWELIGGHKDTCRAMWAWAEDNGRTREEGHRGDLAILYEPAMVGKIPGNPKAIRHVITVIRPISMSEPEGWAMSQVNPKLDGQEHEILMHDLGITRLEVLGYIHPDWASLDVEPPPMEDPEPPVVTP